MRTSRPIQILTVAFALSMLTAYVVHSQRQQTRSVAPSSKMRVLDELTAPQTLTDRNGAASQKPFTVAPGSKGGMMQMDEVKHAFTRESNNVGHPTNRMSSFVASSSKSISPLLTVRPDARSVPSITSSPVTLREKDVPILGFSELPERRDLAGQSEMVAPGSKSGTISLVNPDQIQWLLRSASAPVTLSDGQIQIFDLGAISERPAPSGKSAKVFPGSKSATVITPRELQSLIGSNNWILPDTIPAAKKTNNPANSKSQP